MHWRGSVPGEHRLDLLGMALARFASGGVYLNVVRVFALIVGVAVFSTTMLVGSLLWGYVSRKSKERQKTVPLEDLFPHASHKPNTVVTLLDEFEAASPQRQPPPRPPAPIPNDDNDAYFDSIVFDPEHDYAQVLVEARSNASAAQVAPFTHTIMPKDSKESKSWMLRSHSARTHNPFSEDPPLLDTHCQDRSKSSKSWKKLLFWRHSKKRNGFETDLKEGVYSSCATPLHYALRSPKTKATVAPTSSGLNRKRSVSGPLYNAGVPYASTRNGRSVSGPLSASSTPSRDVDNPYESPYVPLRKSGGGAKISSGPLYVS